MEHPECPDGRPLAGISLLSKSGEPDSSRGSVISLRPEPPYNLWSHGDEARDPHTRAYSRRVL
jgi:hypothetical protein